MCLYYFVGECLGLYTALVTGSVDGKTTASKIKADMNHVKACIYFSISHATREFPAKNRSAQHDRLSQEKDPNSPGAPQAFPRHRSQPYP